VLSILFLREKSGLENEPDEGDRKYTGSNQHTRHLHISINKGMGKDTSPWFWWINQPKVINQLVATLHLSQLRKHTRQKFVPVVNYTVQINHRRKNDRTV
jgi:hypothetical protein